MSDVKRFTRTCDCVTEVRHGDYVLYAACARLKAGVSE